MFRLSPYVNALDEPRRGRTHPHRRAVVESVRDLVENTGMTHREIMDRTGVNSGTISRWIEKRRWKRPAYAWPSTRQPGAREARPPIGRAQAQRLRIQAERLLREIEAAPSVDTVALADALRLLAQAEQRVRRRPSLHAGPEVAPVAAVAQPAAAKPRRRRSVAGDPHRPKGTKAPEANRAWMMERVDP